MSPLLLSLLNLFPFYRLIRWDFFEALQVLPPSVPPLDQEEEGDGDLSLASPPLDLGNTSSSYSTGENPFDLSLSHLQLHNNEDDQAGLEDGEEEEEVRSPPPMVLEEVEEGPETSSGNLAEEKEKEGDGEEKKE